MSARINALSRHLEHRMAQAIQDGVPLQSVAAAAGTTVAMARSVQLAYAGLPRSGTTPESHVKTLGALTLHAGRFKAEKEELRRQQEQIVVTALELGLLDAPWLAAVSGLSLENILARRTRQNAFSFNPTPEAQRSGTRTAS